MVSHCCHGTLLMLRPPLQPLQVGPDTVLEDRASVKRSVVGSGCSLGTGTKVGPWERRGHVERVWVWIEERLHTRHGNKPSDCGVKCVGAACCFAWALRCKLNETGCGTQTWSKF